MMYIHFCKTCSRIHMLNGHKMFCPRCSTSLTELQMSYLEYAELTPAERTLLTDLCSNEASLKELGTTYRMYKYNKWYKEQALSGTGCASYSTT